MRHHHTWCLLVVELYCFINLLLRINNDEPGALHQKAECATRPTTTCVMHHNVNMNSKTIEHTKQKSPNLTTQGNGNTLRSLCIARRTKQYTRTIAIGWVHDIFVSKAPSVCWRRHCCLLLTRDEPYGSPSVAEKLEAFMSVMPLIVVS